MSNIFIEDGTYVRIKNLAIGYTVPKKWLQKVKIENLRVYFNVQNLWTITGYNGYDPEVGVSPASANVMGLDNGRYPSPTTYSVGLSIGF